MQGDEPACLDNRRFGATEIQVGAGVVVAGGRRQGIDLDGTPGSLERFVEAPHVVEPAAVPDQHPRRRLLQRERTIERASCVVPLPSLGVQVTEQRVRLGEGGVVRECSCGGGARERERGIGRRPRAVRRGDDAARRMEQTRRPMLEGSAIETSAVRVSDDMASLVDCHEIVLGTSTTHVLVTSGILKEGR